MANTLVTTDKIANEVLLLLESQLGFIQRVNRTYDGQFAQTGAKIGNTLNVRLPAEVTVGTGQEMTAQDYKEETVAIRLDTQRHVGLQFSSQDLLLSMDDFSNRVMKPTISRLAAAVESQFIKRCYKKVGAHVGVPGTTPSALTTVLQAKAKLDYACAPYGDQRYLMIEPTTEITLVNALSGLHNPIAQIGQQNQSGVLGRVAGFEMFASQNVPTHTVATIAATSTPLTNGTTADGASSIVTNGWSSNACTINEGDVVSIAGVYKVKPDTKDSTGQLMQFAVTQTGSDTTGDLTIYITPSIILTGARQNCTVSTSTYIASGAAVYVFDKTGNTDLTAISGKAAPQNLAFHRDAFVFVSADLPLPSNKDAARQSDKQLGLSCRVIRDYDVWKDQHICRVDILFGGDCVRPELACRMSA